MSPGYGPPWYDVSRKVELASRKKKQTKYGMYSSDWFGFGEDVLRGNPVINRHLQKLAHRTLFMLKQEIPIGDSRDGHIRNNLKIVKHPRGNRTKDRDVYMIEYAGNQGKFSRAMTRATYPSKEAWQAALRGRENGRGVPQGPYKSWVERAAARANRKGV